MKIKNVFDTIFSMDNLYLALEDASKGRRYNKDVLIYNLDSWALLNELRQEILNGTYKIDKYFIFYIYEPKKRMIMSISFRHRIIQWAIYRVINPILVKGYIEDSYGCIPGRGSLSAMNRLKYWLEQVSRKDGQWFYLKLDISKYFYRVSHRVLKKILAKKIKDQRLLDALDQFCKRVLCIHFYIRYMDDVIILGNDKMQLRFWKDQIEKFLLEELELNLNKKTCIRPISQGIEFVGYRLWPNRVVIRKSTSLRIKRALRGMRVKYSRYEVTFQDVTETLQSYLGMLEHCDSEPLVKSILDNLVLTHADQTEEVIYEQTGAA